MGNRRTYSPEVVAARRAQARSIHQDSTRYQLEYYYNNEERLIEGSEYSVTMKKLFQREFGYDIQLQGRPLLGVVTKIIKPYDSVKFIASTGLDENPNPRPGNDLKKRLIAFVYLLGVEPHEPAIGEHDHFRKTGVGRFISFTKNDDVNSGANFSKLQEGDTVWVNLSSDNQSPTHGGFAGSIIGLYRQRQFLEDLVKSDKAKIKFRPDCKSDLVTQPGKKYFVGRTDPQPNTQMPPIRKFKTRIKTGFFGNGHAQTKEHFRAALNSADASFLYGHKVNNLIGSKNSFIWIGHMRNNGYLDILDRPNDLGRETIIYAPATLNVYAPIEIKYYFHDQGGFGQAWTNGPDTSIANAIQSAQNDGNDFREKIGPAIVDMIRDKRNFILVIPEMAHSKGFGTPSDNINRINKMTANESVSVGSSSPTDITLRVAINPTAIQAVNNYLTKKLPFNLANENAQTILQKTHLRERETVSFDGSFTGGDFGAFHSEVLDVIGRYISPQARENIEYKSIVADGLGAISLASISKQYNTYTPSAAAKQGLMTVNPNRIDYIENGQNVANSFNFSDSPLLTFYREFIRVHSNSPRLEFNYITDKIIPPSGEIPGKKMFDEIGFSNEFSDAIEGNKFAPKGQRNFFAEPKGKSGALISMHTVSDNKNASKCGYAFSLRTDFDQMQISQIQTPESTLINAPSFDSVPNHAEVSAQRLSEGVLAKYGQEQADLESKLFNFENDINSLPVNKWENGEGNFKAELNSYLDNRIEYHKLEFLIQEEIRIRRYKRNRSRMLLELNDKKNGLKTRLSEQTENIDSQEFFNTLFPPVQATPTAEGLSPLLTEVNTFTAIMAPEQAVNLPANTIRKALTKLKLGDKIPSSFQQLESQKLFVNGLFSNRYTPQNNGGPGIYDIITREMGIYEGLQKLKKTVENTVGSLEPIKTQPSQEGCDPQPLTLDIVRQRRTPITFDRDMVRMDEAPCIGKTIEVVSDYQSLREMIEWDISNNEVTAIQALLAGQKAIELETSISELDRNKFQTKTFKYRARGVGNSVKNRESPMIWACMTDKISEGWNAACNLSGYVPFRIYSGIKGYKATETDAPTPGYNAYTNGMHIGAWGLSINVDNPIAGYKGNGDPVYSVFTGMWTPGFADNHQQELYDLGVLKDIPHAAFGLSGRYLDNAYQGFTRTPRLAENWKDATDSVYRSSDKAEYDNAMNAAQGSQIVLPDVDPVLWVLTFCERTGMKWGNSFFMRKRYRGARTGNEFLGIEFRESAPVSWNLEEQKRISAIYGIEDVVARINAISFPQTSYDAHMHFQYYNGPAIIPWSEIKKYNKI